MGDQRIFDTLEIRGRWLRLAKLKNEGYDFIQHPEVVISALKGESDKAELFTFLQEPHELEPKNSYHREQHSISIVPITTYDHWWEKQINAKTRNMVRKASKCGVELRVVELDDSFIEGVVGIYNESPIRQGKRFWHYGMTFPKVKAHLDTFTDRSHFVGAFHGDELIGFFKLTRNQNFASVMQIISKVAHRDKAPNNALLAKAVEMCAEMGIPYLQYGIWAEGSLGEYRIRHGFVRFDLPRYFVPLNAVGHIALQFRLYRNPSDLVPRSVKTRILSLREAWYSYRYKGPSSSTGQ